MGFGTGPSIHRLSKALMPRHPAGWPSEGASTAQPALKPAPVVIYLNADHTGLSDHSCSWECLWALVQVQCNDADEESKYRPTKPCFTCQSVPGNIPQFYQPPWSKIFTADITQLYRKPPMDFNKVQPALNTARDTMPGLYFLLQSMTLPLISLSCFSREKAKEACGTAVAQMCQQWVCRSQTAPSHIHSKATAAFCHVREQQGRPFPTAISHPHRSSPFSPRTASFSLPLFTLLHLTGQAPCSFLWHQCLFLK